MKLADIICLVFFLACIAVLGPETARCADQGELERLFDTWADLKLDGKWEGRRRQAVLDDMLSALPRTPERDRYKQEVVAILQEENVLPRFERRRSELQEAYQGTMADTSLTGARRAERLTLIQGQAEALALMQSAIMDQSAGGSGKHLPPLERDVSESLTSAIDKGADLLRSGLDDAVSSTQAELAGMPAAGTIPAGPDPVTGFGAGVAAAELGMAADVAAGLVWIGKVRRVLEEGGGQALDHAVALAEENRRQVEQIHLEAGKVHWGIEYQKKSAALLKDTGRLAAEAEAGRISAMNGLAADATRRAQMYNAYLDGLEADKAALNDLKQSLVDARAGGRADEAQDIVTLMRTTLDMNAQRRLDFADFLEETAAERAALQRLGAGATEGLDADGGRALEDFAASGFGPDEIRQLRQGAGQIRDRLAGPGGSAPATPTAAPQAAPQAADQGRKVGGVSFKRPITYADMEADDLQFLEQAEQDDDGFFEHNGRTYGTATTIIQ